MSSYLYAIRTLDSTNHPLGGVYIDASSDNGPWQGVTDECGWFHAYLAAGGYHVVFTKQGFDPEIQDWSLGNSPKDPILVGLRSQSHIPSGKFPPIPSRSQVCSIQESLQGLTYQTSEFGPIPAWFYPGLNLDDRAKARQTHKTAKDTHIWIPISAAYKESGTLWPNQLKDGYDYTQNLDEFRKVLIDVICDGLLIDMPLAGDGLGLGPDYNDPVGRTYGHGWLVNNLERIIRGLQGDGSSQTVTGDLTPYIIFRPGWDAVFYGWGGMESPSHLTAMKSQHGLRWRHTHPNKPRPVKMSTKELDDQQKRVKEFGELFRRILPNGYLAIEHTPGNIPCGEGGGDYAPGGLMTTFDTIMGEFHTVHEDSFWQIAGRMVSPYHRPSDQPTGDDPHPPFYLATPSDRGPYFYVAFEPTKGGVYEWCRGLCTLEQVKEVDSYMRSCGCTLTGFTQ